LQDETKVESSTVPLKESSQETMYGIDTYDLFEQEKLQRFDAICECVE